MFQKFDEVCTKVLKNAKIEMQKLKHPFVGTEHLMLSILSNKDLELTKKLNDYNIFYDNFKEELLNIIGYGNSLNSYFIYTPLFKRIIENAILDTREEDRESVNINDLFLSLLDEGEGVAIRILINLEIDIDDMYLEFLNKDDNSKYKSNKKLLINEFATDLVKLASENKIDPVIGRDKEINRMIEILLRRTKNNPLLIGDAGVGKTAVVEGLALKISNKNVPSQLLNKKIMSLSLASLVAGTKYRGEFEEKVNKIIKEIENNPDIILFIDEVHSLVGAGGAEGAIDASNIFKPALARGKLRLIGATTIIEYKNSIEKDKALARRFQTILINEPSKEETKEILLKLKPIYERFHQVTIKDQAIDTIINLCDKYILNRKNPDKSIDILDEVCILRKLKKDKNTKKQENMEKELEFIKQEKNKYLLRQDFLNASYYKKQELVLENKLNNLELDKTNYSKKEVSINDINEVIKNKVNIPVYENNISNLKELKNLENNLKKEIIGQDKAISILVNETKKIKLGLKNNQKPISFLFTGKSGIGKTELVKQYAKYMKMELIRIDASEYKESHAISKLIGSPPGYVGYDSHNSILESVKNNPFSVILIDEIEKSSNAFIDLFLQILNEGFITDSKSDKIYFKHAIIIFTSNITSNINTIGFNQIQDKVILDKLKNILKIEFINRITHIIQFNELTKDNIKDIINKNILEIRKRLKQQDITINIDKNFVNKIIELSNYNLYGARNINTILESNIDNLVIDSILNNKKKVKIS